MASIDTFLFLSAVLCVAAGSSEKNFVTIKCKAENVGLLGRQSMLECSLQWSAEVSDFNIRVMSWSRKGSKPVLVYNRGKWSVEPGYKVAASSWNPKDSNISLLIEDTTVAHDGEYTCLVVTDSGDSEGKTSLKVKAEYSPPKVHSIPEKIVENDDSMLICESGGGYPKGQLRWFDVHNQDWTASSEMEVNQTKDGLFQLSSKLTLLRGSTYPKYTCVVFNASGSKEAEVTFDVLPPKLETRGGEAKSAAHFAAPLVVIGSLAVGLLLVLLLRRRRQSLLARRLSTRPLMNNHSEVPIQEYDVEHGDHQKMDKQ